MMDDNVVKAELEVGDWITIYGVPFQVTALRLIHDKVPAIELKHPLEMVEVCKCPGAPYHHDTCPLNKNNQRP